MSEVPEVALRYADAALSVIPIKADGSKHPESKCLPKDEDGRPTWKPYQAAIASAAELEKLFGGNHVGVAIVCGYVSGNLEDIDFDDLKTYKAWHELLAAQGYQELLDRLVKISTPRPGVAVLYRCPKGIGGNQKLAQRLVNRNKATLVETRGEGGYFLAPGCPPECHPTGRLYEVRRGDICNPPMITAAERAILLDAAKGFNEYVEPANVHQPKMQPENTGGRPGDDYTSRTTWPEILEPHGWKLVYESGGVIHWCRPAKDYGTSATTNYGGSGLLYVFSSNAAHFELGHSYSKFAAFAHLNFDGDYKAAARDLAKRGFGKAPGEVNKADRHSQAGTGPEDSTRSAGCYIEFAPAFLAVEDPPVEYLINELIPQSAVLLLHGEPRTCKSWAALEIAVALATGTAAFGLERFSVPRALPVLYSSQEDAARQVRIRTKALLRARGIDTFPETLAFSVHKGINLESQEWQEPLIRDVSQHRFGLVIFDPIRRYAPSVDKGPGEVRTVTAFLRRLSVETGVTVGPVHHDVKPGTDNRDDRRRGHRASGGDWFAAADCPIAFEHAGQNSLVIAEDYKFCVDPQAFTFWLETDDPHAPTSARLIGQSASAEDPRIVALQDKIVAHLHEHPAGASCNVIVKHCRARREDVLAALNRLLQSGDVDCYGGGSRGKTQTWFLPQKEQK